MKANHWTSHLAQAIRMAAAEAARTGRSINGVRQYMGPRLYPLPAPRMTRKMAEFLALAGSLSMLSES